MTVLQGVGESVAADLAELGINTVLDLVTHYPRRYIDGTRMVTIAQLSAGEKATVLATVEPGQCAAAPVRTGQAGAGPGRAAMSPTAVAGSRWSFFNQAWRAKQLPVGTLALFFGPVGTFRDELQMVNPTVEVLRGRRRGRLR